MPALWLMVPALVIMTTTYLESRIVADWTYIDWVLLSAIPRTMPLWTPMITMMAAAAIGAATSNARSPMGSLTAARPGLEIVGRPATVVSSVWTLAFVVGLLPHLLVGASRATTGGPDWLVLLSGVLGFLWFTLAGMALGVLVPTMVVVPLVGVVAAVMTYSQGLDQTLSTVLPVVQGPWASWGAYETTTLSLARSALFALTGGLLLVAAASARAGRRPLPLLPPVRSLAALLPIPVLAGSMVAIDVVRSVEAPPPQQVCREVETVRICVPRAAEDELPELAETTARMLSAYGRPITDVPLMVGSVVVDRRGVRGDGRSAAPSVILHFYPDPQVRLQRTWEAAAALSGVRACTDSLDSRAVAEAIAVWLLDQAGRTKVIEVFQNDRSRALADRLDNAGRTRVQRWIADHNQGIRDCKVLPRQLPR